MTRKWKIICLLVANIMALIYIILNIPINTHSSNESYMISTHYFADEWPMNFWNAEWDTIDYDFEQIRKDGFNTIIVVVPWREFQPEISPVTYNEEAFGKLNYLLETADKHELCVQIRAGYIHDFEGINDPAERFYEIVWNQDTRKAWYDYMGRLYEVCTKYDNFAGGFITWEDFWHNYALIDYVGGTEAGLDYARRDSFGVFLNDRYTLDEFNAKYHTNFKNFYDIWIPSREECYVREWFEYVDNFTLLLLQDTRKVFPGLFMEVRTDADAVIDENGEMIGFSHAKTWNCAGGEMSGIMYKISQGMCAGAESLTVETAILSMENWLLNINQNNGQIPIYMEQFLFYDNAPGFPGGDIISYLDANEYFAQCVPVLKKYTNGYGVWIYKDYCNNLLYNPQFALGLKGWSVEGDVICDTEGISNRVCVRNGGISQNIPYWRKSVPTETSYIFSMNYDTKEEVNFTISVGAEEPAKTIVVAGQGKLEVDLQDVEDMCISISCDGEAWIDNLKLYNHVSTQQLYGVNGEEKLYIDGVRKMNCLLTAE